MLLHPQVATAQTGNTTYLDFNIGAADGLSGNGRFVVHSGNVYGQTSGLSIYDRETGQHERVDVSSAGMPSNNVSFGPIVSGTGRFVAFGSAGNNLVNDDSNFVSDCFVRDRQTGQTTRESFYANGAQLSTHGASCGSISDDGRYIVIHTQEPLVTIDTNGDSDVYVRDRTLGTTTIVSVTNTGQVVNPHAPQGPARISADGRFVTWAAFGTLVPLMPGAYNWQVWVRDLQTSQTTLVSRSTEGVQANGSVGNPVISGNGRYVAFYSGADNLVAGDGGFSDAFVHDRETGETSRVSVSSEGAPANFHSGLDNLDVPFLSYDGRFVAFVTQASNLVPSDTNNAEDIFVRDRVTQKTFRATLKDDQSEGTSCLLNGETVGSFFLSHSGTEMLLSTALQLVHFDSPPGCWDSFHPYIRRLSLPPIVSPSTLTTLTGRTGTFTADAVSFPGATFQWQVSTDGGGSFTDVVNGGEYSGATSSTLSVTPATTALNGYLFRFIVTNVSGTPTSEAAILIVRDIATVTDFDGDGQSDLAIFRPSTGEWHIRNSSTNYTTHTTQQFGLPGDVPVPGDYDGDDQIDLAVYRPPSGMWFILRSSDSASVSHQWGLIGDLPMPGDYDGDGKIDPAVYRPSTGEWYVLTSSSNHSASTQRQWGLPGDIPVPGDYDGDDRNDPTVYRPASGTWYILTSTSNFTTSLVMQWGLSGDVPVPGDYDGDGTADLAVYRPNIGTWFVLRSTTNFTTSASHQWGLPGDVAVPSDYDGDGITDLAVYRRSSSTWYVAQSTSNYGTSVAIQWGLSDDVPAPDAGMAYALARRSTLASKVRASDFDGDGESDVAYVYNSTTGTTNPVVLWARMSSTGGTISWAFHFGYCQCHLPVPHDYDGDGKTDIAVFNASTGGFRIMRSGSSSNLEVQIVGVGGDVPVPGDYNGDGKSDAAVYRPSTGVWHILSSSTAVIPGAQYQWGLTGDIPVHGDYDNDTITDLAVYRPATGEWFIRYSSTGYAAFASFQWGLNGDIPVPGEYDGDGRTDLAVYRPSTGEWFVRHSSTGYATSRVYQWGLTNDIPVPGDFDGDAKTDLAVYRPSTQVWYLLRSSSGFTAFDTVQWGFAGVIPILQRP